MNEFINIPVPVDRVFEVYAVLGRERATVEPPDAGGDWSDALVARCYRESPETMKGVLVHLAERTGGKRVGADELANTISQTRRQLAGVLGAFGRRVKNRYSQPKWPFHAEWNHERGMWEYWMDSDVGEIVLMEATKK